MMSSYCWIIFASFINSLHARFVTESVVKWPNITSTAITATDSHINGTKYSSTENFSPQPLPSSFSSILSYYRGKTSNSSASTSLSPDGCRQEWKEFMDFYLAEHEKLLIFKIERSRVKQRCYYSESIFRSEYQYTKTAPLPTLCDNVPRIKSVGEYRAESTFTHTDWYPCVDGKPAVDPQQIRHLRKPPTCVIPPKDCPVQWNRLKKSFSNFSDIEFSDRNDTDSLSNSTFDRMLAYLTWDWRAHSISNDMDIFFGGCEEAWDYMNFACMVADVGPLNGQTPAQLLELERKKGCLVTIDRIALMYFPSKVVAKCGNGSTELTKIVADNHQLPKPHSTTVLKFPELVSYYRGAFTSIGALEVYGDTWVFEPSYVYMAMPAMKVFPRCGRAKTYVGEVLQLHPSELSTVHMTPTRCSSGQPYCQPISQGWAVITQSLNILDVQDPIPSSVFFSGNLKMGTKRAYLLNNYGATAILWEHFQPWLYVPTTAISKVDPELFSSCHVLTEVVGVEGAGGLVEGVGINAGVWDPLIELPAMPTLTAPPDVSFPLNRQIMPSASPGSAITRTPLPIESNTVKPSSKPQDPTVNHPAKPLSAPQPNISNGARVFELGSAIAGIISQLRGKSPQQIENSGIRLLTQNWR